MACSTKQTKRARRRLCEPRTPEKKTSFAHCGIAITGEIAITAGERMRFLRMKSVAILLAMLPLAAAFTHSTGVARRPLHAMRCGGAACSEDDLDTLVLYGDSGVILAYGSVQALFDVWVRPLNELQPGSFAPVLHAPSQAICIAAVWVGITLALKGYQPEATRSLSLTPLLAAWVGSSAVILGVFLLLGLPLDAEADFLVGSGVVVGGWRYTYSQGLYP